MTTEETAKLYKDTFSGEIGQRCLKHLRELFVDRPVFRQGSTFEETAFREGERSVVLKIIAEAEHGD